MKLPDYLHVGWDTKPTKFDKIGCDGMYIKSIRCPVCGRFMRRLREYETIPRFRCSQVFYDDYNGGWEHK